MQLITPDEQDTFAARGFLVLERLADEPTLGLLEAVVEKLALIASEKTSSDDNFVLEAPEVGGWAAWQRGTPAFLGTLRSVSDAHLYAPDLLDIAASMHLPEHAGQLLRAAQVRLVTAYLWAKPPRVGSPKPWHQDLAYAPPDFLAQHGDAVTFWIAVDDAGLANGCLQFLPGSHRRGLVDHVGTSERMSHQPRNAEAIEPHVKLSALTDLPGEVAVPLPAGSAVAFSAMVLHRSGMNNSAMPRRALSFVYASSFP
jgi:hypothetical protein